MTPEQSAAYIMSQVACASIEVEAMEAANCQHPNDQPYSEDDFRTLIVKYGIDHNSIIELYERSQ